jgi:hypothetical protein
MRARKVFQVLVLTAAGLASVAGHAESQSSSRTVITVAEVAPLTFSSTAVPQSLRSPNFNSHLEFSPQVELAYTGPVRRLTAPTRPDGRAMSIPVQGVSQRSLADSLLLALLGITLIAYQLFRKHRLLRPQPFSC